MCVCVCVCVCVLFFVSCYFSFPSFVYSFFKCCFGFGFGFFLFVFGGGLVKKSYVLIPL